MYLSYLLSSVQVKQKTTGCGTSGCVAICLYVDALPVQLCADKTEDSKPWYKWVCSYATYVLLLMLLTYLLNQLDRYMLAITSMPLARDVHFGDKACAVNKTLPDDVTEGAVCNATEPARWVHTYT